MGKHVKISDLEISEREWPILVFRPIDDSDDREEVLHICHRNGKKVYSHTSYTYTVTDCNRAICYTNHFDPSYHKLDRFKLCSRCGTRQDFEQALRELKAGWAESQQQLAEERARREKARREAWIARRERAWQLAMHLGINLEHLDIRFDEDTATIDVWYENHHFKIEEMEE